MPPAVSSRLDKQLDRLAALPKDYEWRELQTLLRGLGFNELPGNGSRYAFRHSQHPECVIRLHKPHNRNPPTINIVYVRQVVERLKEWGHLE